MTAPKFNAPVKEHVRYLAKRNSELRQDFHDKCKEVIALEKKVAELEAQLADLAWSPWHLRTEEERNRWKEMLLAYRPQRGSNDE
jgi:predicted nuclease with TOPRIM domain